MALYQIEAPDGKVFQVEGPAGASQDQLIAIVEQQRGEARSRELKQRLIDLQSKKPEVETTFGGNVKETFKGIVPGAINLAETAGTGIAALLPEDTERVLTLSLPTLKEGGREEGREGRQGKEDKDHVPLDVCP